MRTIYLRGLNKGFGSKFREGSRLGHEGSRVLQEAPKECQRAHRPKRCEYNNKDEDNSLNNLNNTHLKNVLNTYTAISKENCLNYSEIK